MNVNNAVVAEAEANTPKSGYDVDENFYTLAVDENTGRKKVQQVAEDGSTITDNATPAAHGYKGLLIGDEFAPNGSSFASGISFPLDSTEGDYFLRTDFLPQRMFRWDGKRWLKVHDVKRAPMNNGTTQTLRGSFINDVNTYLYDTPIAQDFVRLTVGQTNIDTEIAYTTAKYVQIEYTSSNDGFARKDYTVSDNAGMLTSYDDDGTQRVRITLPASAVKDEGLYSLTLHNERTQQRQAISQVLKPKADN
jgi:hypothetical protein